MAAVSVAVSKPQVGARGMRLPAIRAHVVSCHAALLLGATFPALPASAGRTDRDWMAPPEQRIVIDMPGSLEMLDPGRVDAPGDANPAHRFLHAEARIGTRDEIRAALNAGPGPAGNDPNASFSAIAALLERWRAPAASSRASDEEPRPLDDAPLDCALFAATVSAHRATEAAASIGLGVTSRLDMPLRCVPATGFKSVAKARAGSIAIPSLSAAVLRPEASRPGWRQRSWSEYKWPLLAGVACVVLVFVAGAAGVAGYKRYTRWDVPVQRPLP